MKYYENILELIGNTPVLKLNRVVEDGCATILAKLEYLNPMGSVKERMALYIIEDAEKRGILKPGGTIVDNTSGNAGIGAALIAALKGYRSIFAISDKMSQEKIDLLKALGAEVVVTPADVPPDHPESCIEQAKKIAKEIPGSFHLNQYHNQKNIEAHYNITGPEIWEQTDGKLDCFVAGIGTYIQKGTVPEPELYQLEGIGSDVVTLALDKSVIDEVIQVSDKEAFLMTRRLCLEEGLYVGGSSGACVVASLKVAKELGKDKVLVTVMADTGSRYLSKIYSDSWMREHGFLDEDKKI
ncbi:MAG: hypothetical protein AMJ90_09580 [candidate division Zixibacteria bacterium SM23_73_2]|nr:MAG: hypothetical protein AMJ90_09580 [candidate division Zixibacteria bacterium SM23_73_2]